MSEPPPDATRRRVHVVANVVTIVAMVLVLISVVMGRGHDTASSFDLWIGGIAVVVLVTTVVQLVVGLRRR